MNINYIMSREEKENEKLRTSYKTCIDIFEQRGYIIVTKNHSDIIAMKQDGSMIYAFMVESEKFNTEIVQEYIKLMVDLKINHSLIVYKKVITPFARRIIEKLPSSSDDNMFGLKIELYSRNELQYNITKHKYQPNKFESLTENESKEFIKKYIDKLPVMLQTDPIVRFYGFKSGRIIEVTRKNGYVAYRIVQ
jgi:DNA-directed RNA polymerase subunit H (RpoH/RPB5)